jgi:hypothetical protein
MKRLRAAFLLGLGALALSSCTLVSPNAAPENIPARSIPFGLLDQTIPGTNNARVRFITQPVYIVDATNNLAAASRIVPTPASLSLVLQQLIIGPTAIERSAGYTSALPESLVLVSASVRDKVGYLNFATPLNNLPPDQQLLAVGQLVLTAADVGATAGLVIKVAGVEQNILLPSGAHAKFVTEKDFANLLDG